MKTINSEKPETMAGALRALLLEVIEENQEAIKAKMQIEILNHISPITQEAMEGLMTYAHPSQNTIDGKYKDITSQQSGKIETNYID